MNTPVSVWPNAALAFIFSAVLASPSVADQPLESLLVTANRIPTAAARIGSASSVIERELINQRQTIHSVELLQDLAGVAVSRVGVYGAQTQVRVRGAEANQVLVLIDGVKANDPAGGDEFDFSALTSYDIERIELVRGPQSALWGSEAAAGVINVTTREANEALTARGFVEAGSRETLYTGATIGSGNDRRSVTFNGSYFETAGESAALAGTEDDGYQNASVGLTARWRPTNSSRLSFSSRYTDTEVEFDDISFITGLPTDADLVSENDLLLIGAEGGVVLLDDRWDNSFRLTWLDSDRQQFRDDDWESSTAAEKIGAYYQSTFQFDSADQKLVAALDYEDERFEQRGFAGYYDPNQDQQRDNLGLVVEYLVAPVAGLDLSVSLRHDDNSDFEDITTYRLTGSFALPNRDTRLRGSYGTGQKAPTFTELYGYYPGSFVGNPELKPEQTRSFDIGLIQGFLDGRLMLDIGYFNERLMDEIVSTFDSVTFLSSVDNLTEHSQREGLELEFHGQLSPGLDLGLSYTFTDSTQPDGVEEVRRPRHMAALNLNYRWLAERANVNLNLSYTGAQTDQIFLPPTYAPETVTLSDYLLVNLTARYTLSERFEVYARADNLFDEDYVNVVGYRSPGRSVHLGLRFGLGR